jgi:hypothetical protein
MTTNVKFRIVAVVVAFTILLGVYTARLWPAVENASNFGMYYTAACLVRSGMSTKIYDVVDRDTNPQVVFADPSTVFAQTALAHGITRITLYLYPPTLADLIVPLTALPFSAALIAWYALDVLMIVGLSMALTQELDLKFMGSTVLVAAFVLLFRPTLNTLHFGQVTIVLAFLLTVGFSLYVRGQKSLAAFLFVLAIAIKLEPIVVVIPLVAWRDWKCIRNFAIWGILVGLGLWVVNGRDALNLYFLHQLPSMSGGTLGQSLGSGDLDTNRALGNIFYTYLGGVHPLLASRELSWLVRAVSALILCYAGWLSRSKAGENASNLRQFEIGMMYLLFACCLSPYSWFYNWALSAPAVVVCCKRAWDGRADITETIFLIALLLSLSTSKFSMAMITPILGVTLGIVVLYRIRLEPRHAESGNPINQLKTARA